jgi:hypothetical protein
MKVHELFEGVGDPYVLSEADFENLSPPDARNIDHRFKVGKVAFDEEKGLGSTPYNQDVIYKGFVAEMKPSSFLKLVPREDRTADANNLETLIRQHAPLASPFLCIKVNMKKYLEGSSLEVKITSHEGRARTWAFDKLNGNVPMPVHFILMDELRAKNLSEEFFKDFRKIGLMGEGEKTPTSINFGRIFWQGKEV